MIEMSCVSAVEVFAIQATTLGLLLFLLTADDQTYPNPTELREWHHLYLGLVLVAVGIVCDLFALRMIGAALVVDDAWQHVARTMHRDPDFQSPLAWLYACTLWRIPLVQKLNRALDALFGR